ncbi:hypothetical protein ACFL6H_05055 [Candidatus Latescibacterota bacterium]
MKFIIRVFMVVSAIIFALVTVIKFVQGCSYKEAVGIAEELFSEIMESCARCCGSECCTEDVKKS